MDITLIGLLLIFIGIFLILISVFSKAKVKESSFIAIIGPFPIVIGTEKAVIIGLLIVIAVLFVTLIILK
ncbi:MAG: hypothetical protein QXQ14_01485 [Candidatus Aenigmatarchaeota archaeon]